MLLKLGREGLRKSVRCRGGRRLRRSLGARGKECRAAGVVRTNFGVTGGLHLPMRFGFDDQEETDMLHSACSETPSPCFHVLLHISQTYWKEQVLSTLERRLRKMQKVAKKVKRQ